MAFRDKFNSWLLKQNWLDSKPVQTVVKPFESGSRFGIGGGGDVKSPAFWAGVAAGAITLAPGALAKIPQLSRAVTLAKAGKTAEAAAVGGRAAEAAGLLGREGTLLERTGQEVRSLKNAVKAPTLSKPTQVGRTLVAANQIKGAGTAANNFANRVMQKTAAPQTTEPGTETLGLDIPPGGDPGTGGGLGEGFLQFFNGQWYTDPESYYNAVNSEIDSQYFAAEAAARGETEGKKTEFSTRIRDLLGDLESQQREGQSNIGSYYSNLGDIYQSSEGVRRQDLNQEVDRETGRLRGEETAGISSLDSALARYLDQLGVTRRENIGRNFQDAASIAQALSQGAGSYSVFNPEAGASQIQSGRGLLDSLSRFLAPTNTRRAFGSPTRRSGAPINSFLNAYA